MEIIATFVEFSDFSVDGQLNFASEGVVKLDVD